MAYLLFATAAETASAMTSRVIFISPNNAYFISNQGETNGFVAGKDVCFDDPKVGRITCARIHLSTPTASAYVLLSKFSDFVTLDTLVSPLRWRVNDREYNKKPSQSDIRYLKEQLAHLDTDEQKRKTLANSSSTNDKAAAAGATAAGLNTGSNLSEYQKSVDAEQAAKTNSLTPSTQEPQVVEKVVEKVVIVEKPGEVVVEKEVVEKIVYKEKVVYKDSSQPAILSWPVTIELSYLSYLALPVVNNRVGFNTQSENETTYWKNLGEIDTITPSVRFRFKQYFTDDFFYGIKFSSNTETDDSVKTQYDLRIPGSTSTTITGIDSLSYGVEFGGTITRSSYFGLEYNTGLSVFSAKKTLTSSYTAGASSESLANITQKSDIFYLDNEIITKLTYNNLSAILSLGLGVSMFDLGGEASIQAFDPNRDQGDQTAASKQQLADIYEDPINLLSYFIGLGLEYRF